MLASLLVINSVGAISTQASDTITATDFGEGNWSKSIDLFAYARQNAEAVGGNPPPDNWTSETIVNYINQNGVEVLYMGMAGIDFGQAKYQLPLQSIVERFNTTKGEPAMTASSFLMLMAFNDTKTSKYPGSPDKGDNLWASFSQGTDYSALLEGKTPKLTTSVTTTPLKVNGDEYTWGMTYKDLAAIWWNVAGEGPKLLPAAFCIYDELGFNYRLIFNKVEGTAKLFVTYEIGEMRDLWTMSRASLIPTIVHYNNTGTYNLRQQKIGSETLHGFLEKNKISMSILMSQRTWVAEKNVTNSLNGSTSAAEGAEVSNGSVQSTTPDGQKVFEVNFGEKKTYKLETNDGEKTYDAITRIADVKYYTNNPLLKTQNAILLYTNALLLHIAPVKYTEMAKVLANSTKADYLYITSYPTYSGYKVIHDPVYTAYTPKPQAPEMIPGGGLLIPAAVVILAAIAGVLLLTKRRH
jgi:hypothetical protein